MKQREGMVSLDEFRKGIMFGYINRHIKGNKVFIGDTINNKKSRWSEDGIKDLMCEKIKKYEDDAIKNAIRNDSVHNANNVYRQKKVKETETPGVSVNQVMLPDKERCNNKSNEQLKGKKHKKKQQVHLDNNNNNSIHDTINNVQNKTKEIVSDISNAIDTGASIVKDVTSGIGFIKGKVNKYKKDKDK
jgi:ribosomal protein L31E